jgi:ABC-type lipoprotein release transport system permease subunit
MQRILLGVKQIMRHTMFVLSLMTLITLSGLFIFTAHPSYAVTRSMDKLSADEKVDRAYQYRQGTGMLEEVRQEESPNASEPFDPSDEHKVKSVKASKEENPEPSLPEQLQKVVKKVTGQE